MILWGVLNFLFYGQQNHLKQTIHPIQGRHTIRFRHGRIVKCCFNKILNGIVRAVHHRLTNVDNLCRIITKAMHTQYF